jgi:L-lysine 2,3-aminomutase
VQVDEQLVQDPNKAKKGSRWLRMTLRDYCCLPCDFCLRRRHRRNAVPNAVASAAARQLCQYLAAQVAAAREVVKTSASPAERSKAAAKAASLEGSHKKAVQQLTALTSKLEGDNKVRPNCN